MGETLIGTGGFLDLGNRGRVIRYLVNDSNTTNTTLFIHYQICINYFYIA